MRKGKSNKEMDKEGAKAERGYPSPTWDNVSSNLKPAAATPAACSKYTSVLSIHQIIHIM